MNLLPHRTPTATATPFGGRAYPGGALVTQSCLQRFAFAQQAQGRP
jgi:hypothetical protein